MNAQELGFRGAYLFSGRHTADHRGDFDRLVELPELRGLVEDSHVEYVARARNRLKGTLRGLHFQAAPHGEAKTLWCETGAVFDVLVDLRPEESTFGTWMAVELDAERPVALHVPRGVAHGYQTLADETTLVYLISAPYVPEAARTINWADPALAISWPHEVTALSDNDRSAPIWGDQR